MATQYQGLTQRTSIYDVKGGHGQAGGILAGAEPPTTYNTEFGTTDSPFRHGFPNQGLPDTYPAQDHLVALLVQDIQSTRPTSISPVAKGQISSGPEDLDLEYSAHGEGLFHGVDNPSIGDGKKMGNKDLHEMLLDHPHGYTYTHGNSTATVMPAPNQSPYQDSHNASTGISHQGLFGDTDPYYVGTHTVNEIGKSAKTLDGIDLHEHLLTRDYTYTTPGEASTIIKAAPNQSPHQDLFRVGFHPDDKGLPTYGTYTNNPPELGSFI